MAGEQRPEVWWDDERYAQWEAEQEEAFRARSGTIPQTERHHMPSRDVRWAIGGETLLDGQASGAGGRGETQPPRAAGATHDFRGSAPPEKNGEGGQRQQTGVEILVLRCCMHAPLWAWVLPRMLPQYFQTAWAGAAWGVWLASVTWALDRWLPYEEMKAALRTAWLHAQDRLPSKKRQ